MISVTIDDKITPFLVGAKRATPSMLRRAVLRVAQTGTGYIRRLIMGVFKGSNGGLARSFEAVFLGATQSSASAGVFSDLIYADIQNRGGTIKAKTGKMLAIPLLKLPVGKWPRHFPKGQLKLIISNKGKGQALLAKVSGKGKSQKITPYFVLKKYVQLSGKRYIETAADFVAKVAPDIMQQAIEEMQVKAEQNKAAAQ